MDNVINESIKWMLKSKQITPEQAENYRAYLEEWLMGEVAEAETEWRAYKDSWID